MNSHTPQLKERTWRDEVMDESMREFNRGDIDVVISTIRRLQPHLSCLTVWEDRQAIIRFIKQECQNVRSFTQSEYRTLVDSDLTYHLGWWQVSWRGQTFEVVFNCSTGNQAEACLGEDNDALYDFTRALLDFAERPTKRALQFASGEWTSSTSLDTELGKITWNDLTLPAELLQKIRESVETFFAARETVQSFGFAWKRGLLLVGPPGTGKTMVCKAAATALPELPFLYVRDLRERSQKESIESIFKRARQLAPCLLVFEDLDSLINESNRTVFLNEMDGFASNEGLLIIASSNHPGKIDEALLKRPSRFDRVFHLGLPELPERRAFCEKILTRESLAQKLAPGFDIAGLCDQVAHKSDGFTPAYLKEAFVSAALSRAQSGATLLDDHFAEAVLEQVAELKAHLKKTKNPDALAEMRSGDDAIGFRR